MITFDLIPSHNPLKIALYLDETGEPYALIAIDTRIGNRRAQALGERLAKCQCR